MSIQVVLHFTSDVSIRPTLRVGCPPSGVPNIHPSHSILLKCSFRKYISAGERVRTRRSLQRANSRLENLSRANSLVMDLNSVYPYHLFMIPSSLPSRPFVT